MEHLDLKTKITIMISIMSAMLFAALNQTIVGTALPRIISELGGMEYFSWVFTIFMLASSVTAILVGKLTDIYGRKPFILSGIGIFITGTFLCGTSDTIIQLIIYRGIQGFGGGMIMSTAFTAVGDLFPPRERGRWQGLMAATFGLASVLGPTLGGYIVDHWDWHWVFWVFLPFGIVAFVLIWLLFPSVKTSEKEPVDYLGSALLALTIVPLLLAFTWAGNKYDWFSLEIIGLFSGSAIALVLFIITELKVKSPVLPLSLFKNSIFTLSNLVGFIMGMGMFGAIMYMPMFIQAVIGTSATKSGFIMMPMTLGMVFASTLTGQLTTRTGKYKKLALFGLIIMSLGMYSMSTMNIDSTNTIAVMNMITVGFGLGIVFPIFTLTIQNAVEHRLLGVATASVQLFRQLGGTVGVAVMGTIMNSRMMNEMGRLSEASASSPAMQNPEVIEKLSVLKDPQILMNPDQMAEVKAGLPEQITVLFDQVIQMMREALSYSLEGVFLTGTFVMLLALVLTFFLKEIPLRTSNQQEEKPKTEATDVQYDG